MGLPMADKEGSNKRKAADSVSDSDSDSVSEAGPGEGEALDMFPAPPERASDSDDALLRETLKTDLLTFPEAAAMDAGELDDAVNRIIREYNPATATPIAQGMVRFDDNRIIAAFINAEDLVKIPTAEDFAPTGVFPPGWLEARRRELDEEVQAHKRKEPHSMGVLLAKIRVDLLTKGYVDVPKLYLDYRREK